MSWELGNVLILIWSTNWGCLLLNEDQTKSGNDYFFGCLIGEWKGKALTRMG